MLAVPHQIRRRKGLVGVGAVVLAQIHVRRRRRWVGADRRRRPVVAVGAGGPVEAVPVGHKEGAVAAGLGAPL